MPVLAYQNNPTLPWPYDVKPDDIFYSKSISDDITPQDCPAVMRSLDVTQQGHAPQYPVVWSQSGPQVHGCDVVHVCPHWLLIDRTGVQTRILHPCFTHTYTDKKRWDSESL